MNMKKYIFIISCFSIFFLPIIASAATLSMKASPASIGVGDVVRVDIFIGSYISVNAFSGTVSYSSPSLEPIAVSDGSSIVNLWINHPSVPSSGAEISFEGITPGGFSGDSGALFSVLFKAKESGVANVSLGNIEVLRNDGAGSKEPVTAETLALNIEPKSSGGYSEPADLTAPESFTVYLGNDTQLFGGKYYLVFATVDKNSGIDHYEVAESRVPSFLSSFFALSWSTTTSPYIFADQNLTSTVYIKAVDRAGNEQFSICPPSHLFTIYEDIAILVILITVVLLWKNWRNRRPRMDL